jgi:hypothetical protein
LLNEILFRYRKVQIFQNISKFNIACLHLVFSPYFDYLSILLKYMVICSLMSLTPTQPSVCSTEHLLIEAREKKESRRINKEREH